MSKKKFIAILTGLTMVFTLFLPKIGFSNNIDVVSGATSNQSEDERISFEEVKNTSETQTFSHDEGGNFKVWASTLSVDPVNKLKKVVIYGKFDFPLSSTEIGIDEPEEYPGKLFLPRDESYIEINGGLKSYMLWSDEDPNSKWDKQIFVSNDYLYVRGSTAKLVIKEQEFQINIPDKSNKLVTSFLEEAITEHWGDYIAAKYSGLKLTKESEDAYLAKDSEAKALINTAKNNSSSTTQDVIDAMRLSLNESFAALMPLPYERDELSDAVIQAEDLINSNGENGKRFTKDSFDALIDANNQAHELLFLPDLQSILTPREGEPIKTHKDFDNALLRLKEKMNELVKEDYTPIDLKRLWDAYDDAINLRVEDGYGYTDASRESFYNKLDEIRYKQFYDDIYMDQEDLDGYIAQIEAAKSGLEKIKLDENVKVNISIKYTRPLKDSVSSLLKEYFRDANNDIININKEVIKDSEVVIYINDTDIVKAFEGYSPKSFHYNSDDGTLGLVKYFEDKSGHKFVVFKAASRNEDNNATLDIYYEENSEEIHNSQKPNNTPIPVPEDNNSINKNSNPPTRHRGGSGGGGGNFVPSKKNNTAPKITQLNGNWELNNNVWRLKQPNGSYLKNSWAYTMKNNSKLWYLFDNASNMVSGWYKTDAGKWYYFNPAKDSNEGVMLKGWQWIKSADQKERCYYFGVNEADEGLLYVNTVVEQKYTVDENGAWTVGGIVQTR